VALAIAGCATSGGEEVGSAGKSVNGQLSDIAAFRASGHTEAALAALDHLLKQVASRGGAEALAPATRAAFERELEASRAFVSGIGAKDAGEGHPLAAEAELARLAPLLAHPELAEATKTAAGHAREVGRATCARIQASVSPDTPHWGLGVSRYCDHFGVAFTAPPLAAGVSKVDVQGAVVGMTPAQNQLLSARIGDWFAKSLWYEPTGLATARASLRGKIESSFQHQTVPQHVSYTDEIETSSSAYAWGTNITKGTYVTGSSKTEMDRVYTYDAEEHRGHYGLTANVSLDVGAAGPLTFTLQKVENLKAYEHDNTFAKAGVRPSHETVPSTDEWLRGQLDRMEARVILHLNRKFVTSTCGAETESLEAAARCVLVGQTPAAVVRALSEAIGEDAQRLGPILHPPPPAPPAEKPRPRPAKPRPARRDVVEDDESPVID
jgi:hypothetical protein